MGNETASCHHCGSGDFICERTWLSSTEVTESITCECGNAPDGIAARRTVRYDVWVREWGYLDEDLILRDIEEREETDRDEEQLDFECACSQCLEEGEWEVEEEEETIDEEELTIQCQDCGAEMDTTYLCLASGE